MKVFIIVVTAVVLLVATLVFFGTIRRKAVGEELLDQLERERVEDVEVTRYDPQEIESLPDPVRRYFRKVLSPGQPIISAVTLRHDGSFNMSETGEQWKPFTSRQRVITRNPGFDWEGRIEMVPGLPVWVHDAYIVGRGILQGRILGLFTVVDYDGTADTDRAELMRYLAEAAWYPTALLPSQGLRWEAADSRSAVAHFEDQGHKLSLLFRFNAQDLIESVYAEERPRAEAGEMIPTPWEGRWSDYQRRDGILVPMSGEVAWLTPEGRRSYWRGRIEEISFEYFGPEG
ncbi:MAG TPA: hypothetical protein ENN41_10355 [Sediminispirochaeta sp.]|nr:hypothetical protein [Sediminispirochaeta sp.]